MYLKIEIDGEESFFSFPDKKRVSIGRAPTCDIQVIAEGISRIHMEVHEKLDGEFYAIDKGSTHGTFINDEPLQKDKPVTFDTFFPARLGPHVFVYLMDELVIANEDAVTIQDVEPPPLTHNPSKASKIESPPKVTKIEFISTSKHRSVNRRAVKKSHAKEPSKKIKRNNRILSILSLLALIGFVAYKQWEKTEAIRLEQVAQEQLRVEKMAKEKALQEKKEQELAKIQAENAKKLEEVKSLRAMIGAQNCLLPEEHFFCDNLKKISARTNQEGAVKQLDKMYVIVDLNSTQDKLVSLTYSEEEVKVLNAEAMKIMGRRFHPEAFKIRQNSKLTALPLDEANANYYAFSDFIYALPTTFPPEMDAIKEIILIALYQGEYKSHLKLDFTKIKQADLQSLKLKSKMLLRSNVNAGLYHVLKQFSLTQN